MKIIIVDDNETLANTIKDTLENYNNEWEIFVAYSGKEAIDMIPMNMPDIMIVDIMLPDMSGLEVLREIKEIEEGVQVIIMTAHASISNAVQALQYGAFDYIQKPVHLNDLVKVLETAIKRRKILLDTRNVVAQLLKNNENKSDTLNKLSLIEKMMVLRKFQLILKKVVNKKQLLKKSYEQLKTIFRTEKIFFYTIKNNEYIYEFGPKDKGKILDNDFIEYLNDVIITNSIGGYLKNKKEIISIISFENEKWGFIIMERDTKFKQSEIELAGMLSIEIALKLKEIFLSKSIDSKMMGLIFAMMSIIGINDATLKAKFEKASSLSAEFANYLGMDIDAIEKIRYNALMYNLLDGNKINGITIGKEIIDNTLNNLVKDIENAYIGEDFDERINNINEQMSFLENMKSVLETIDEHFDGNGAKKMRAGDIPIEARIISICNTFNNLINKEEYKDSVNYKKILDILRKEKGKKFDPDLIDKFEIFVKEKFDNKQLLSIKKEKV